MCDLKTAADVREECCAADDHVVLVTASNEPVNEPDVSTEALLIPDTPNNELKRVTINASVHVSEDHDISVADCENNNQTRTTACSVVGTTVEKTAADCSLSKCSELVIAGVGKPEHETSESQITSAVDDAISCTSNKLVNGDNIVEAVHHTVNGCVEDKAHTLDANTDVLFVVSTQLVETVVGCSSDEKKLDSAAADVSICSEAPGCSPKTCDVAEKVSSQMVAATAEQGVSLQNSVIQVSGPVTSSCSNPVPLPVRACHVLPSLPQLSGSGKRLNFASVTSASDKMPLQRTTLSDVSVSTSLPVPHVISQSVSRPLSSTTLSSPSLLVGSTVVRTDGVPLPVLNLSTHQETIDPSDLSHTAANGHQGERNLSTQYIVG
jgi:hypothetical protein